VADLNHGLLKPLLLPRKTLLRHTLGLTDFDIFAGSFNGHMVVTYSKQALKSIKGGV
jgi:hypothetical protein